MSEHRLYGLLAEFDNQHDLVEAARKAHQEGYRKLDCYSPVPVEELHDVLHIHDRRLPFLVLAAGIIGGLAGFALMAWISMKAYPLNVGGRPLYSWPAFIPVTFECAVLAAALAAVAGMVVLNGLPQPYHPVFNVKRFAFASRNRFFLCIEAADTKFDPGKTRAFLETCKPREVSEVLP